MSLEVSVIANCDDAAVFWRIDKRIPDCLGFAIHKEQRIVDTKRGTRIERTVLENRMGFSKDEPEQGDVRPSTEWPFQRFWWVDYSANLGDEVRYRVCPIVHERGKLLELTSEQSAWTAWNTLTGSANDGFSSFFNRGLVISQFMARYLEDLRRKEGLQTRKQALAEFKKSITHHEVPIRHFLSGALRNQMLTLLGSAKKQRQHVYAALYELEDEELVSALSGLGKRAHVVLANGSIKKRENETSEKARKRDQNKAARKELNDAGVEVFDRFISPGALGHNKFLVVASQADKPVSVWSGSTNWTSSGLCTQTNNGILVENRDVAQVFFDQWARLRDAGDTFPKSLVAANSEPAVVKTGKSTTEVWFSRTRGKVDLARIDEIVEGANEAVLFLMFQPGGSGTLATVRRLERKRKSLYVKGVVSTLPPDAIDDESEVEIEVHGASKKAAPVRSAVVQPQGIRAPFASWAATVTRSEFLKLSGGVIGHAIVHSKLIVVDPFTNPVVITGSHNFSTNASSKNDENFLIVRGNRELACHYSAHILAVYHHYRWMAFVDSSQGRGWSPSGLLNDEDTWQDRHLKGLAGC